MTRSKAVTNNFLIFKNKNQNGTHLSVHLLTRASAKPTPKNPSSSFVAWHHNFGGQPGLLVPNNILRTSESLIAFISKNVWLAYEFGTLADTFRLDVKKRRLTHGKEITVTPKVLDVLLLLQNSGNVLEKGRLMKALWPESFVEEGNLSQNIFVLRKILGDDGNSNRFIQTIPRRGYKIFSPSKAN